MLKRVRDAQLMPLRAPELVESQHVDVFDGPVEASQILATFSMFSSESVSPGTSTNRTQIFLPAFASRRPKSMVGCSSPR